MVEMLTVLAVVAILSVVGLAMWDKVMDKHRANTLINEAQKRAVIVAGQIGFLGNVPSLAEFTQNETAGGTFDTEVVTNELSGQFGIKISGVKKSVCEELLKMAGEKTSLRRLSRLGAPTTIMTTCDDIGIYLMVYNDDLKGEDKEKSAQICSNTIPCQTVCATCDIAEGDETGLCVSECPDTPLECAQNEDCSGVCMGCEIPEGETRGTCQYMCQKVEYLESINTGGKIQYIDTGIIPSKTLSFDTIFQNGGNQTGNVFGARKSSGNNEYQLTRFDGGSVGVGGRNTKLGFDTNAIHHITFNGDTTVTIDGTPKTIVTSNIATTVGTIVLFAIRDNGKVTQHYSTKIYSCKFGTVRDFIPVLAPKPKGIGIEGALFDRIEKKLYYNAGTGSFSYGSVIE